VVQGTNICTIPQKDAIGGEFSTRGSDEIYKILIENPEGKRPLGRPRRRWEDNIVTDIKEIG
jgi:hypothetical protein